MNVLRQQREDVKKDYILSASLELEDVKEHCMSAEGGLVR